MSSFNAFGKPAETVDFGGEVDYASYEWFKDPPPSRPEVISFLTFPYVLLTHICSLPSSPLRANPTSHLPLSSRGITCVTLLSRPHPMYCSGATNSTDRCIYPSLHPAFFRANDDFFPPRPQLGVLAWCAEFSEMIDELKRLGISGDMFVSTREAALGACEEILRLQLDIKMQIIVIHLSSQVARLRRFLDAEHVWHDYPETDFPIDPHAFS
jgi:hypothetical protein